MTSGSTPTQDLFTEVDDATPSTEPRRDHQVGLAVAGIAAAAVLVAGLVVFVITMNG